MKKNFEYVLDIIVVIFGRPIFFKFWGIIHYLSIRLIGVGNFDKMGVLTGEKHMLVRLLRDNQIETFFDVGANYGQYSEMIKRKNNDVSIYSFEAHPKTFEHLKKTSSLYQKFNVYNYAIGNPEIGDQKIKLYDYDGEDGSQHASVHKEVFLDIYQAKTIKEHYVDLISLSDFCAKNKIGKISFLKIDTEGNELDVLKGAKDLINNSKIDFIHFEFNVMNLGKTRFYDFWILLNENYSIYRLLPYGLAHIKTYDAIQTEIFHYQNYLAKSKKIKSDT